MQDRDWLDLIEEPEPQPAPAAWSNQAADTPGNIPDGAAKGKRRYRTRHYWNDAERDLLRQCYGKVATRQLAERFGTTSRSVTQQALKLGLSKPKAATHVWTEEEDQILRRDYRQTHASRDRLANLLGLSSGQVGHRISLLGLCKVIDRRNWTAEENALLEKLMDQGKTLVQIARIMKRSASGVRIHANRALAMSFGDRNGWFTKNEVCRILGRDHRWVQTRIDSGALRAKLRYEHSALGQAGLNPWQINERDLADFVRTYPEELTGRNVDLIQIINLFAPIQQAPTGQQLSIAAINHYQDQGWSQRRIASHFGVHPNTIRQNLKQAGQRRKRARPPYCSRGHELTGDNVYVAPSTGRWYCRFCRMISQGKRQGLPNTEVLT